jgi:cytochrome c oxidase subunit 4
LFSSKYRAVYRAFQAFIYLEKPITDRKCNANNRQHRLPDSLTGMTMNDQSHHIISYRKLTGIWLALLVLTALTVGVTRLDLGGYKVLAALTIACCKAGLVIAVFMHMKYEGRLLRWLLFLTLVTLMIFIGVTFFDVLYR